MVTVAGALRVKEYSSTSFGSLEFKLPVSEIVLARQGIQRMRNTNHLFIANVLLTAQRRVLTTNAQSAQEIRKEK
jgi:hypothetical protein